MTETFLLYIRENIIRILIPNYIVLYLRGRDLFLIIELVFILSNEFFYRVIFSYLHKL